jgi:hypothetical protein
MKLARKKRRHAWNSTRRFSRYVKRKGGEYPVKITTWFLAGPLLFGSVVASSALSADGILLKEEMPGGYCHLQFTAIREETLSAIPELKDASSGDRIDYYGSCDHDPLGKDEIEEASAKAGGR